MWGVISLAYLCRLTWAITDRIYKTSLLIVPYTFIFSVASQGNQEKMCGFNHSDVISTYLH